LKKLSNLPPCADYGIDFKGKKDINIVYYYLFPILGSRDLLKYIFWDQVVVLEIEN
jgi:hypothetical protein